MSLTRIDHVAIEVADLDRHIDQLVATGGMRLLRRGFSKRTNQRLAMVGDPTGMKLELIESSDAVTPHYLHLAFRSDDAEGASRALSVKGWTHERGPVELEDAQAKSVLLSDGRGFELQVLTYRPTSPDVVEWSSEDQAAE